MTWHFVISAVWASTVFGPGLWQLCTCWRSSRWFKRSYKLAILHNYKHHWILCIDLQSRQSWQKYDIPKSFEWKGRKRCRFRPSWLYIVPEIIINNDTAMHSGRKWLVKYGTTTISTQRPLWPIFRTLNSKVVCNCFRNATLIFHILIHSGWIE